MSVLHFPLAVLLVSFGLVVTSQLIMTMDSWGHQLTENLRENHSAVEALDGPGGLIR